MADAKVENKKLRVEASIADELIETSRVKHPEFKSKIALLTYKDQDMRKEVHLCKFEVNAMTK